MKQTKRSAEPAQDSSYTGGLAAVLALGSMDQVMLLGRIRLPIAGLLRRVLRLLMILEIKTYRKKGPFYRYVRQVVALVDRQPIKRGMYDGPLGA